MELTLRLLGAAALLGAVAQPRASVTFSRDVAPIIYSHCLPCHHPGHIGPFALISYADVRQHARQIVEVTTRRVMPPWKPDPRRNAFRDQRVLSDEEIRIIQDWVAQGAVEGDAVDLPAVPERFTGWELGEPDVVVTMPEPFTLAAGGPDVFRTFVLPIPTTATRYVRAIEFRPGNPRAVHHANIGVDRTRSSRLLDLSDAEPGYVGGMVQDAAYPPGQLLGWTPGQRARPSPERSSWRLEPESDLVVQLHMQPTGKPEAVQVSAGFFFTSEPPERSPIGLRLGSETIDIAPGDANYVVSDSYVLPVDAEVLAIQPHAHNLARQMEAVAHLPDGSTRPLIAIEDWDFRWQDVYRYVEPILLPRGTTVSMRFRYDNSRANIRNPYDPPRRVVWGQNTTDEMGDLWIQLVARSNDDFARLNDDVNRKTREEDLAAYTKLLEGEPNNPLRHDAVAMLYLEGGLFEQAMTHFRDSLRFNPDSAPTRYNLGLALLSSGRLREAAIEFQETIKLNPEHAEAHNNLGATLQLAGQLDEAATQYRRALALRPDNTEAQTNLARVLTTQGRFAEAAREFRAALARRPEWSAAQAGLAWLLATSSRSSAAEVAEAVDLAERAARATGGDAGVLDTLAAAYAAVGDFAQATTTARRAVDLAQQAKLPGLADQIRLRLRLYERGTAYRVK